VNVEVDHGHALQAVHVQRVLGRDGDVVEQAEAHRLARPRMVAGRADGAKGVGDVACDHGVGGRHGGTGGAQGRFPAVGVERGVAVDRVVVARLGHVVAYDADGVAAVVALDVGQLGQRCVAVLQQAIDVCVDELVGNRLQPRGRFGMPFPHFMALAVWVAINCCTHVSFLCRRIKL
jgi:hypothetical protein